MQIKNRLMVVSVLTGILIFLMTSCQNSTKGDTGATLLGSFTVDTNTNGNLKLSWDEFDDNADTTYTVYAYNLTIRTPSGGTVPTSDVFLENNSNVHALQTIMFPIPSWSDLDSPNTPEIAQDTAELDLYTGTSYVFVVMGKRSGSLIGDKILAGNVDISPNTGNDPLYYIVSSNNDNDFHVVVVDPSLPTWEEAATAAMTQGGLAKMVEINSQEEQTLVETALNQIPDISGFSTVSHDRNDNPTKYLWIGAKMGEVVGDDLIWIWDGDNDDNSSPMGVMSVAATGSPWKPANSAYENWGDSGTQLEPNNYCDDEGYGVIGLEEWNYEQWGGGKYQWNDIGGGSKLSGYIMEVKKDW